MHSALAAFLVLFSLSSIAQTNAERVQNIKTLRKIAFGSCNNQNASQPLWKDIATQGTDLWMWTGDAVYADWGKDGDDVRKAYEKQNSMPDYLEVKNKMPIIGTWDDHDYGFNNAGGSISLKRESQKLFLDFIEEPQDSPRRNRDGVYTSYDFGEGDQRVKIILLDNRFSKGLESGYHMLGKAQWEWLENEFKTSTANLHIIVTGLSIFSPTLPYTEEWWEHPSEVNRLQEFLKTYKVKAPVFITGDKHFSTIFRSFGQLEFLSSGMTHVAPRKTWWYLGRKYPVSYFGISYGRMDIDWDGNNPKLKLWIRNGERNIFETRTIWKKNTWEVKYQFTGPSTIGNEKDPEDNDLKEEFASYHQAPKNVSLVKGHRAIGTGQAKH